VFPPNVVFPWGGGPAEGLGTPNKFGQKLKKFFGFFCHLAGKKKGGGKKGLGGGAKTLREGGGGKSSVFFEVPQN